MTSHLTADGNLTNSQLEECNKLNLNPMDYRQIILDNLNRENTERVRANHEKVTVECKNPVIIVGHGPDWEKEVIKIKGTKIPIIATDVCSRPLMDMGIIPTYITTYEEAYKRINEKLFDFKRINEHSVQVIGSTITREWMEKELDKIGMDLYRYDRYQARDVSNVGIFSCMFAHDDLEADKVILIGMNSWDGDKSIPYLNWYVHWRKYIGKLPKGYFVNCTQGGLVYGHGIIECDFDNLVIKNIS